MALDLSTQAEQLDELRFWYVSRMAAVSLPSGDLFNGSQDGDEIWKYLSRWLEHFSSGRPARRVQADHDRNHLVEGCG